jgi:transcriptional/translational regulatory protein YebC/TACO1
MTENFAHDIVENLSEGRSITARSGAAEAITSQSGELSRQVYDTDQETYLVEVAKWDEDGESHKVTTVRESGEEVYVLSETNGLEGYESDVSTSPDGIYSEAIETRHDFNNLLSSLEEEEEIHFESRISGDNYAVSGGIGKKAQD